MTKLDRWVPVVVCLCLFGPAVPSVRAADVVDKKTVVTQATAAYFNLRRAGLVEFRSTIQPNWNVALGDELRTNPAGAKAALSFFDTLHFSMRLDPQNNVAVDHRWDAPPPEALAQSNAQITGGIEQIVTGFFQTWSPFMLAKPFPPVDGDYTLEDTGTQYRLGFRVGNVDTVTTMGRDFAITQVDLSSSAFISWVKPQLTKTADGFVLIGYTSFYKATAGDSSQVSVKLDYTTAGGLPLPHTLGVASTTNGGPVKSAELVFTDYQVTNR